MRRPPTNLDDFLSGGEGAISPDHPEKDGTKNRTTNEGRKASETSNAEPAAKKKSARKPAQRTGARSPDPKGDKQSSRSRSASASSKKSSSRTSAPASDPSSASRPQTTRKASAPMIESTETPNDSNERRGRTVPGEAAPTVIMSVRVPIDLRERLEDILAAYSGVTFSDLVIRGLQSMVNEVEQRHRERTGEELPKRQSRPEFPL